MSLATGTRLGPYEVTGPAGAGGMGEVYRARDTRLERTVAIKVLPAQFSSDPDFRQRFEREARAISSLQHPHICVLHDVGHDDGIDYLVMEYLEGETLAQRLERGAMPLDQVLKTGVEIADALDKAHRQGIAHRDLKPSNIMLTKSGAKLMDFGLAKPLAAMPAKAAAPMFTAAPTLGSPSPMSPLTSAGMMVGTIQYMSPEQIAGREADARSDIFAFGAVVYEMLTGRPAFSGKSQLSVASAIMDRDPEPLATASTCVTPALAHIVSTCLAKDPDNRFQTARDVSLELRWLQQSGAAAAVAPAPMSRRTRLALVAAGLIIAALAVAFVLALLEAPKAAPQAAGVTRFSITLPPQVEVATDLTQAVALSRDGKRLAYVALKDGISHLYVRRFDSFDPVEISDSEGALFPFFSPDGEWVGFFDQGKLEKAPSAGGAPVVICSVPSFFGGAWTQDGSIIFTSPGYQLATVNADGGTPEKLVFKDTQQRVTTLPPSLLPGDKWVIFVDRAGSAFRLVAYNRDTHESHLLVNNAQSGYFARNHLVYYSAGAAWAVPLDLRSVSVRGAPVQLVSGVAEADQQGQLAASQTGVLAYAPGSGANTTRNIFLVDRHGAERKADLPPEDYVDLAFAPDGKRFAVAVRANSEQQLAVYDLERGVLMRVLSNGQRNAAPAWTPDGKSLVFDSLDSGGKPHLYRMAADGSSAPQVLRDADRSTHVTAIAGGRAALMVNDPATSTDVWLMSLTGDYPLQPFRRTPAMERQGTLSPDGKWMAYASNESGRSEIYVEPVPAPGGRWQISTDGGEQPRWARTGREIFYRNGTRMMTVPVETQPTFRAEKPALLFDKRFDRGGAIGGYDVSPDGLTFVLTRSEVPNPTEIRIVIGWPDALNPPLSPAP